MKIKVANLKLIFGFYLGLALATVLYRRILDLVHSRANRIGWGGVPRNR